MSGFLLGLANGTSCIAVCAPVLIPYLVAEGRPVLWGFPLLWRFLAGRLLGYLLFGIAAGLLGSLLAGAPGHALVFGLVDLGLAVALLVYGFVPPRPPTASCAASRGKLLDTVRRRWPALLPFLLGLLTGVSLCPPFALALASATQTRSVAGSAWFFLTFFLGTSVFFIPLPGLGALRRFTALRTVARLAAGLVGANFLYRGVVLLHGGLLPR
jgi:sulfite exporter TauE/SafE